MLQVIKGSTLVWQEVGSATSLTKAGLNSGLEMFVSETEFAGEGIGGWFPFGFLIHAGIEVVVVFNRGTCEAFQLQILEETWHGVGGFVKIQ